MITDGDHFVCLLVTCMPSLGKCPFTSSPHFLIIFFVVVVFLTIDICEVFVYCGY